MEAWLDWQHQLYLWIQFNVYLPICKSSFHTNGICLCVRSAHFQFSSLSVSLGVVYQTGSEWPVASLSSSQVQSGVGSHFGLLTQTLSSCGPACPISELEGRTDPCQPSFGMSVSHHTVTPGTKGEAVSGMSGFYKRSQMGRIELEVALLTCGLIQTDKTVSLIYFLLLFHCVSLSVLLVLWHTQTNTNLICLQLFLLTFDL